MLAVVYIGVSAAKVPSVWAILLIFLLFAMRPLIIKLSTRIGHGELLLLFGLCMALGGSALFEAVDMKADLGALVFGVMLANTPRADELSKALLSIKELFLIGFFLSIGMSGLPDITILVAVSLLLLLLIFKSGLFFWILSRFRERIFPAGKASLALANYSEFGLIVVVIAVSQGWLSKEWLVVLAVLIAISFIISSAINKRSDQLYSRFQSVLERFQHASLSASAENQRVDLTQTDFLICGMGRVGSGAYEQLCKSNRVTGLDFDMDVVKSQQKKGRNVYYADISSSDFWAQVKINKHTLKGIILCASNVDTNKSAAKLARKRGYSGYICTTSFYKDEENELLASGVDTVFNIYAEAGVGLALQTQKYL